MAIIEEATQRRRSLSVQEVLAETRKLGLSRRDEAEAIIGADRDGGHRDRGH